MIAVNFIIVAIIGYLLGSIPFGVLVGRWLARVDVREQGSGKMGATNVMRMAGSKAGVLVAVLDITKGALAVYIAGLIAGGHYMVIGGVAMGELAARVSAALAAVSGHIWPIFLKFKGGRGVATYFGGLVALCPPAAIFGGEVLFIGAGLTRYVSIGSITGVVAAYAIMVPLTIVNNYPIEYLFYALVGAMTIIFMHRDNISRLLAGTERRLGQKLGRTH